MVEIPSRSALSGPPNHPSIIMSFANFIRKSENPHLAKQREQEAAASRKSAMLAKWKESERILSLLRSIPATSTTTSEDLIAEWYKSLPILHEKTKASSEFSLYAPELSYNKPVYNSPNEWFDRKFSDKIETLGVPFVTEIQVLNGNVAVCKPVCINAYFFAALMGGDKYLGHQVVYYPPEERFYYLDPVVQAFRPATVEKLQVVVSHYLLKCAEACSGRVNIRPLVEDFCKDRVIRGIVEKAKAILEADRSFFEGEDGKVRYLDGKRLNPADGPSHRQFATEVIARQQGSWLTISEAYCQYAIYCRQKGLANISPPEFKGFMAVEIRESMNVKLRHDVPGDDGKQTQGWKDLACLAAA